MNSLPADEGVIKYHAMHLNGAPPVHEHLNQLDEVRTELFGLGLVGAYPGGIGYGNVSIRHESGCIISGTATGAKRILGASGYCVVRNFDLKKNTVYTKGPVNASSESMTHCAIYEADSAIQCVLHIHSRQIWLRLLKEGITSTPVNILYGTPEMALSMAALVGAKGIPRGLLVMSGHDEGIVAYGESISLAFSQIKSILNG